MALTTDLAAFWDFNDDTADDQHTGGIDWTENGTITYTNGSPGRAVVVSGGGNTLTIPNADASAMEIGTGDYTFVCRLKSNTFPVAFNTLFSHGGSGTGDPGILITHKNNGEFLIRVASATGQVQQTYNEGNILVDTEGFVVVRLNRTTGILSARTDDNPWRNTNISSLAGQDLSATDDVKIATDFQNNGDFTISYMGVWTRYLEDEEVEWVKNGTEGISYESELVRDGWNPTTNCARWKVTAKAAQIGGSATQEAKQLVITEDVLPDDAKDSDNTYHITSANLRASLDSAGTKQVPLRIVDATPNATPANATYEIHVLPVDHWGGDNTLDGTSGTDIYLWYGLSGATQSPAQGLYGSESVTDRNTVFHSDDGGRSDTTRWGTTFVESGGVSADTTNTKVGGESTNYDGSNDDVEIGGGEIENFPSAYTLALWARMETSAANKSFIVGTDSSGPTNAWANQLRTNGSNAEHYTWDNTAAATKVVTGTTTLATGTWYHLVATAEAGGNVRLYVNGSEEGTALSITTLWPSGDRYRLGDSSGNSKGHLDGQLDAVTVLHEALSGDQITTMYNNQNDPASFWDSTASIEEPGGGAHTLIPNDLALASSIDSTAITQNHVLSPAEMLASVSIDASTIVIEGDAHTLSPNDQALAVSVDSTTITQVHILSPGGLALTVSLDNASISTDAHLLSPNDSAIATTVDATTITQIHILNPSDLSISTLIDIGSLSQVQVLSPNDMTLAVTIDSTLVILPSDVSTASISFGAGYSASVSLGTF